MHCVKMWQFCVVGILFLTTLATGDEPNIVIIGAGSAGIAAASKLFENGFQNITILEAEDRIGGRVYTTWFDESWIDLGGQWIEGETNNTSFQLASPLGLVEVSEKDFGSDFNVYNSNGCQLPTSIGNTFFEIYINSTETPTESLDGNNGSIGDYLTRTISMEVEKYPAINETLKRQFLKLFEAMLMAREGSDSWDEVSVRGYLDEVEATESTVINWKDRGYSTILDILMKRYPNPEEELPVLNNTLLNSEVVNINYQSTEGKAVVETRDGQKYTADHVIVTASLGVLKENYETLFTPQLPELKVKAVQGISMGLLNKIYLSFEAPWWPENIFQFGFIWDDADWQEYENDPKKKWLLNMISFTTVAHRPRLLCGWVGGASARHMETLPEEEVLEQSVAILNKFLGKSFNITRPTGIMRTKWYSNKHFRGSYSFKSVGSVKANVGADDLAAPLLVNDKPIVMFAGEATNADDNGYVNGAIDTGIREADRLIKMYKNPSE